MMLSERSRPQGHVSYGRIHKKCPEWANPEADSALVGARDWGRANGDGVSFWGEENVLELEIRSDFEKLQSRGPVWMEVPLAHMCLSS